ncbi:MAG: hypothetical protein KDD39_11140 [Bdellovibrionales bacterium]|nr:hypothetical protein [Bdellovibrionales bacterium]
MEALEPLKKELEKKVPQSATSRLDSINAIPKLTLKEFVEEAGRLESREMADLLRKIEGEQRERDRKELREKHDRERREGLKFIDDLFRRINGGSETAPKSPSRVD